MLGCNYCGRRLSFQRAVQCCFSEFEVYVLSSPDYTFCINALVGSAGQTELFRLFNVSIYSENLIYAGLLCVRVILLILLVTLFTLTTSHLEITDAIIWGIRPTAVLKFPVMQFAFILTLTMRFIAIIRDDVERLKKAQSARGANFSGTIRRKVQLLKPLVAPLLLSLFQRAEEISEAMSARCFANESLRLRLKKYKWNLKEIAALGIVTVVFSLLNF